VDFLTPDLLQARSSEAALDFLFDRTGRFKQHGETFFLTLRSLQAQVQAALVDFLTCVAQAQFQKRRWTRSYRRRFRRNGAGGLLDLDRTRRGFKQRWWTS
jgi:hypothetical protein